ncbi:hypothetical protein J1N10_20500 [Carboxylicivirga sp. A043]|uniref:hypothetical protein n=1 Tax=Carboxylicivirga litoralis TaxID=2816963 RepID=UPI0021CB943A|nr:hypothetical protein [Carboxylicivirga sp. A043]MCU4158364.1 hypothetical protein [Carboxylicivirga sp. A043]
MQQYSSNNYFLFDKILYIFVLLIASCLAAYYSNNTFAIVGALTTILICLIALWKLLESIKRVMFDANDITVTYVFYSKQVYIQYSSIKEVLHIFYYPVFSRNTIIYNDIDGKTKKLKLRAVVPNGEYFTFINWLFSKNKHIDFTFLPSDSKLKQEYAEMQ